jgi:2-polyprenyl-3-methyl-5-hydroxy-6-metoxy-1,4-benzoquinol methylase
MIAMELYDKYWASGIDVSNYDGTTNERIRLLLETTHSYLKPGDNVLDLGCGAGRFTEEMRKAGYRAIGMDISEAALRVAKVHAPDCDFKILKADGTIPVTEESFDAVWTSEVIEHILNVEAFLKEIHRVLKRSGILIMTTPYHGLLKNLLIATFRFDKHFDPEGLHIRFFDRKGLERCLGKAHFDTMSFRGIGRVWKLYRTWFIIARKQQHQQSA